MKIVLPFKAHNYYCRILFLWTKAILFPFLYCTYSTLPSHSDWGAHEPAGLLVSGLWPAGIRPMASWYQAYVLLVSGLWPAGIRPMTCWYQVMTCWYQANDQLVSSLWPAVIRSMSCWYIRPMSCWYPAYDLLVLGLWPAVISPMTCWYQAYDLLVSDLWPAGIRPMICWYQARGLLFSLLYLSLPTVIPITSSIRCLGTQSGPRFWWVNIEIVCLVACI